MTTISGLVLVLLVRQHINIPSFEGVKILMDRMVCGVVVV